MTSSGSTLLAAMKRHSEPVKPKHLGVIGKDHLKTRFIAAGGEEATFKYERRVGVSDQGIPYVIEFAFGLHKAARGPLIRVATRARAAPSRP